MKTIFKDENEKRAAILTALTVFILFLWMFFHTAFSYQDPPEEYGMEVNFGTTDTGQEDNQTSEPIKTQPNPTEVPKEPVVEETPPEEETTPIEETPEKVMTEETLEEVPIIEPIKETPKEESKKDVKPVEQTSKPVTETPTKPIITQAPKTNTAPPKPDASTENALLNVLNGPATTGTSSGNEGNDNVNGDKGNENGDPHAPDYYTNPGNGNGGNYNLIGRLLLRRPIPAYLCQKEGRVVVKIKVNRKGKVILAIPGVKGSTTTEKCLLDQAKKAALNTKWQSAANAPEKQIGKIIYNFSLR